MRQASPLPFFLATLAALCWIGTAGWLLLEGGGPLGGLNTAGLRGSALLEALAILLAPAALPYALVAAIPRRPLAAAPDSATLTLDTARQQEAHIAGIASRLGSLQEYLTEAATRLQESGEVALGQTEKLKDLIEKAERASGNTATSITGLTTALLDANEKAAVLGDTIAATTEKTGISTTALSGVTKTLGAQLDALASQSTAAGEALRATFADLEERSRAQAALLDTTGHTVQQTTEAALGDTSAAMDAIREGVAAQVAALGSHITTAREEISAIGSAAEESVRQRLRALGAEIDALDARLAKQIESCNALDASTGRSLKLLDARLAHSEETGAAALQRLAGRIESASETLAALSPALREEEKAATALKEAIAALQQTAEETLQSFAEALPQKITRTKEATDAIKAELASLQGTTATVGEQIAALKEPVLASKATLLAAGEALAAEQQTLATAGNALVVEFEQARHLLQGVEEQARESTLAAASGLVDALSQVNEVARQATARMRRLLADVVSEAEGALKAAATEALSDNFMTPISTRIAEASSLAGAAAERTASSMAALASTLALLDHKTEGQLVTMEKEEQERLLAASSLLGQQLKRSADELAAAATIEPENRRQGLFSRLLQRFQPEDTPQSALAAELAANPDLKARAIHYCDSFRALLARVEAHQILASALQQSEEGRLAEVLGKVLAELG